MVKHEDKYCCYWSCVTQYQTGNVVFAEDAFCYIADMTPFFEIINGEAIKHETNINMNPVNLIGWKRHSINDK